MPTRCVLRSNMRYAWRKGSTTPSISFDCSALFMYTTVARVRSTVERVRSIKREAERFAEAGIDLVLEGPAVFADEHTLELGSGRRIEAATVNEAHYGRATIESGETLAGAARFAAGAGRHGTSAGGAPRGGEK